MFRNTLILFLFTELPFSLLLYINYIYLIEHATRLDTYRRHMDATDHNMSTIVAKTRLKVCDY